LVRRLLGRTTVTARANRCRDEHLAGVPQAGDMVGRGAAEIGGYALARMGPAEFGRFIASVRNADSADASSRHPSAGRGRRMSDQARHSGASPTGPTG
jgi:hypothetical protein